MHRLCYRCSPASRCSSRCCRHSYTFGDQWKECQKWKKTTIFCHIFQLCFGDSQLHATAFIQIFSDTVSLTSRQPEVVFSMKLAISEPDCSARAIASGICQCYLLPFSQRKTV